MSRVRCLVVDGSPVIRKIARHIITELGCEVDEAETGREALVQCKARLPDVVLLDWRTTVINAHAVLGALRRLRKGASKPHVIYCMTENDADDREKALAEGANDFLLKPFDRQSLTAKLRPFCAAA